MNRKYDVNEKMKYDELPIAGNIYDDGNAEDFNTGDWRSKKPVHIYEKCKHCFLCVPVCPDDCIMHTEDTVHGIDYDKCKGCGICAKVCPFKAIEMKEQD